MYQLNNLVKRNIKIFIKDKTAVFFSFLSVIIMLVLYLLFLKNTFLSPLEGFPIDNKIKEFIVISQMMGGIMVINTLTLSLGMMGTIVNDNYYKKTDSFLVTPVSRTKITLSYYISTIIVTYILSLVMLLLTLLYVVLTTTYIYSLGTIIITALLLLLYTIISTSIMMFVITFIKTTSAFGAISGIFGTLIGFVSGIYMPLEILPAGVTKVSSLVPFTHMTILIKEVLLKEPLKLIKGDIPDEAYNEFVKFLGGNKIGVLGNNTSMFIIFIGIILLTVGLFIFSIYRISKNNV